MKETFKLYQETPMWHFQAREKHATLRATELKPKLDRFLIKWWERKYGGKLYEKKKEWLIDGEHLAFDYRVTIVSKENTKAEFTKPDDKYNDTLFLGNIRPRGQEAPYLLVKDKANMVTLNVMTFHRGLMNLIKEALPTFFLLTNFGTRQDKGFGSFVLQDSRREAEQLLTDWYGDRLVYMLDYHSTNIAHDTARLFHDIDAIYKVLKSGINFGAYVKSYLTLYFLQKGIGGEKRFIKTHHIGPIMGTHQHEHQQTERIPDDHYRYIRALLGATDGETWNRSEKIKFAHVAGRAGQAIDRIPSPLVFKPVGSRLFILVNELPQAILGETYHLSSRRGQGDIRIPSAGEFDMVEIMNGFMDYLNSDAVRDELRRMRNGCTFVAQNVQMAVCKGGEH